MNPILLDRKALALYILAWTALAALLAALLAPLGQAQWWAAAAFSLPMMIVYAFMSLSAWYVCRAFPLRGSSPLLVLGVVMLSALLSSILWVLLGFAWSETLDGLYAGFNTRVWQRAAIALLAASGVALYLLSAAVHYLLLAFQASREAERNALELQVLARDAELKALRSQINPHFLFNCLNSVSALTMSDPAAARTMTLKIADFLRLSHATQRDGGVEFLHQRRIFHR